MIARNQDSRKLWSREWSNFSIIWDYKFHSLKLDEPWKIFATCGWIKILARNDSKNAPFSIVRTDIYLERTITKFEMFVIMYSFDPCLIELGNKIFSCITLEYCYTCCFIFFVDWIFDAFTSNYFIQLICAHFFTNDLLLIFFKKKINICCNAFCSTILILSMKK